MNMQAAYVAFFSLFFNCYLSFMKFVMKRPDEEQVDALGSSDGAASEPGSTVFIPGIMGGEGSFEVKISASATVAKDSNPGKSDSQKRGAGPASGK